MLKLKETMIRITLNSIFVLVTSKDCFAEPITSVDERSLVFQRSWLLTLGNVAMNGLKLGSIQRQEILMLL
jgi:hypothetical protein